MLSSARTSLEDFLPGPRPIGCGRVLGRYTLLRRIAVGGMAEVYLASERGPYGLGKKVAIKKLLPQNSGEERYVDMLSDEARIAALLDHPNIAKVYELCVDGDGNHFIVMEYVEGRPLNRLLSELRQRRRRMPAAYAAHLMAEVAKGLDHAHRKTDHQGRPMAIVHRDVSPGNILLSRRGEAKLIDFGIARAEGRATRTRRGIIKGKLRYLAPEALCRAEIDHRADIYCSGLVLFEMIAGEPMFRPKDEFEAIEMAAAGCVRRPRAVNPAVPEMLDEIVVRACMREPSERFQSARDLSLELRRFLKQQHPAFNPEAIADLMESCFGRELAKDQSTDQAAERFINDLPLTSGISERATVFSPAPPAATAGAGSDLGTDEASHVTVPVGMEAVEDSNSFEIVEDPAWSEVWTKTEPAEPDLRPPTTRQRPGFMPKPPRAPMGRLGSGASTTYRADTLIVEEAPSALPLPWKQIVLWLLGSAIAGIVSSALYHW